MATMSRRPFPDAFLPSGGMDTGNHHGTNVGASGSHQALGQPAAAATLSPQHQHPHAFANGGNSWPISSPHLRSDLSSSNLLHGFPPSTLPHSNDAYFLSSQTSNVRSPSALQPRADASNLHPPSSFPAISQQRDFRSTSLSPTRSSRRYPSTAHQVDRSLPPPPTNVHGASYLYRSVSADRAEPPQASSNLVQRLAQQNALIREAWEAERNYLEANRRRAEEVYQEERVIMEEVREGWENEKATLLLEMQTLKERIQRLEGENSSLRGIVSQSVQVTGVVSPLASHGGGSTTDTSSTAPSATSLLSGEQLHSLSHTLSHQSGASRPDFKADLASLPPGLDGASRRPHFASPGTGSSRTSPLGQPESSPFIPLDPRMQTQTANAKDFLASEDDESDTPIPVIDVQEIDPKLEGIPIKATALQKPTFSKSNSSKPTPAQSPPTVASAPPTQDRPNIIKRGSSKDHTFQALQAEESTRLTMHAGHTPNHSLSLFPTMSVADGSVGTANEGIATPTVAGTEPDLGDDKTTSTVDEPASGMAGAGHVDEVSAELEADIEMEVPGDPKLKGPLMIKNIPAQDEIFWDQVNKKLEPISHGQNALPTVMRTSLSDCAASVQGGPEAQPVATVGGDASHDFNEEAEDTKTDEGQKDLEGAVPLKLRSTTNFGAPFGMA